MASGPRRKPGAIRDAIIAVLQNIKAKDASVAEIQEGVERRLGETVPASSVRSYLGGNADTVFLRTGHGRYRLRQ